MTLLPSSSSSSAPCNFPAIFNFGDSNSDTGGLSAAFGQAPAPNGETYFHAPAGRYCDGRLLIDFIGNIFYSEFSFCSSSILLDMVLLASNIYHLLRTNDFQAIRFTSSFQKSGLIA